jgi:hypothetical protein
MKTDYQAVNGRVIACGDSAAIPDRNNPSTWSSCLQQRPEKTNNSATPFA